VHCECSVYSADVVVLLQDLIKFTPTSHRDYDSLQKTLSIAQQYLSTNEHSSDASQACNVA